MNPDHTSAAVAPSAVPGGDAGPSAARATTVPIYRRVLVKLSGEALMGNDPYGINREVIERIVGEIAGVVRLGVDTAVVIGGGNIFRGGLPENHPYRNYHRWKGLKSGSHALADDW